MAHMQSIFVSYIFTMEGQREATVARRQRARRGLPAAFVMASKTSAAAAFSLVEFRQLMEPDTETDETIVTARKSGASSS